MSMHLHRARRLTGWFLVAAFVSPLVLCLGSSIAPSAPLSEVTGRVTLAHHPAGDLVLCLDAGGDHAAYAPLRSDGSFRLVSLGRTHGAEPGRYRAHLFPIKDGRQLPSKYADPATSGVEIDIASGWNDFQIELP